FKGDSAFYTWLFRIASNHCLDHLRKHKPQEIPIENDPDEEERLSLSQTLEAPDQEKPESPLEAEGEINRVLQTLDPDQRLILSLREIEGYSYEELADVLKCGVNTIKSRLNRAREALKAAYLQKFGAFGEAAGNILALENVQQSEEKTR